MIFLSRALLMAILLVTPAMAAEQADPTHDVTDTPNPVPADSPAPAKTETSPESCDPGAYADLLGKTQEEIEAMEFDVRVRIIPEGGRITMEFLPNRVNFKLDADGRVSEITCG